MQHTLPKELTETIQSSHFNMMISFALVTLTATVFILYIWPTSTHLSVHSHLVHLYQHLSVTRPPATNEM